MGRLSEMNAILAQGNFSGSGGVLPRYFHAFFLSSALSMTLSHGGAGIFENTFATCTGGGIVPFRL
jgi:hypothetical protein